VTIGYKRQEAVWMPLLPNAAASAPDAGSGPAQCTSESQCPKVIGTQAGEHDTYSVLATFGGSVAAGAEGAASAPAARANTRIAQFFATGFAARALADRGGAALVNTAADTAALSVEEVAMADARSARFQSNLEEVVGKVKGSDGTSVDKAKLDAAFASDPGKAISASVQADIRAAATVEELRQALRSYSPQHALTPMLQTLRAGGAAPKK
jgi:hypothetical protein